LPIGTFNNIARSIGVLADLPVATNIIAKGHVSEIDVGLANDTHYFFEAAGAGLDATLFPLGEEIKKRTLDAYCAGRAARAPIPARKVQHHL
jgi:diacylglycerol kinase (ATP)